MMSAPGYLFVGMTIADPRAVDPVAAARYGELAAKAMAGAGTTIQIVASGAGEALDVHAGTYDGQMLVLERYSSLEALHAFWTSPEYEEAKPIRRGFKGMDFHFLVAVPGVPASVPASQGSSGYTVAFGGPKDSDAGTVLIDGAEVEVLEGQFPFSAAMTVRAHESIEDAKAYAASIAGQTSFCAVLPASGRGSKI